MQNLQSVSYGWFNSPLLIRLECESNACFQDRDLVFPPFLCILAKWAEWGLFIEVLMKRKGQRPLNK